MKQLFKYILCPLFLLALSLPAWAESVIVRHADGSVSNFEGDWAYHYACNDAVDGDTIIISAGNYAYGHLRASHCVVKGAGCGASAPDVSDSGQQTYIQGWSSLYDTDNQFEGIRFSGCQLFGQYNSFTKCWIERIQLDTNDSYFGSHNTFLNCVFQWLTSVSESVDNSFYNSLFLDMSHEICNDEGQRDFYNCLFIGGYAPRKTGWKLQNCIFYDVMPAESGRVGAFYANQCQHCLFLTDNPQDFFAENASAEAGNVQLPTSALSTIFQDFDGSNSLTSQFQLTFSAAATYTDSFGEQIGLYGGLAPYTMKVSLPVQIADMYIKYLPNEQQVEVRARILQSK